MKISNETIEVLKNFATINTGIAVKKGDVLHTISPQKNIVAKAKVAETFPLPFAIYDLTNLLGVISMYKEGAEIEFHEKELAISGYGGRSHIHYRYTEKNLIITPPEKDIVLPAEDLVFELSADDLNHIQRAAGVLQAPQLVIEVSENKLFVSAVDLQNDAANVLRFAVGEAPGVEDFKATLRTENMKIMGNTYKVVVSHKGVVKLTNADDTLTYWIATEKKNGG